MGVLRQKETRTCDVCEETYEAGYVHQKRCSKECSAIATKRALIGTSLTDFNIFKRDDFRCIYCGKSSIEDGVKLNVEHIIALDNGGTYDLDNLVTACRPCNGSKARTLLGVEITERLFVVVRMRNKALQESQIKALEDEVERLKITRPYNIA
jgi:hypothetical protein